MRFQPQHLFLTFVLVALESVCFAASQSQPRRLFDTQPEVKNKETIDFNEENLSLSKIPKSKVKNIHRSYYYPYSQTVSPRLGLLMDQNEADDGKSVLFLAGFNYMLPSEKPMRMEIGADLVSSGRGHLNFALKWNIIDNNLFRPFYKVGIVHQIDSDDQLATFLGRNNYLALAGVGFEDALKLPMSIRLELEIAVGLENILVAGIFGYSWGF